MMRVWHALVGEQPVGPMSSAELLRAHFRGQYGADALVRSEGASDWRRLAEAFPLDQLTPPPLPNADSAHIEVSASTNATWASDTPFAWRRYFARQLDTLIHAWLMFVFFGAVLSASDTAYTTMVGFNNALVLNILGVALAIVPSAILIGATGRTFGKLIFGLKVLSQKQKAPGILRALKRELQVFFQGLGLGIPIIGLFTMIGGYTRLHDQGNVDWDASNDLTVWYRRPTFAHWLLMLFGIALWLSAVALMVGAGNGR